MPDPIIPVRVATTEEVLYGDRVTQYRWEVLSHSNGVDHLIGELDGVTRGSLSWVQNAAVKGSGRLNVLDLPVARPGKLRISDLDLASARIRPVCVIDGLPENPLGTFLVSAAREEWEATGRTWSLELLDRTTVPQQDLAEQTFAVDAGTLILPRVKTILADVGEYIDVDASETAATRSGMAWDAGTSKLTIINDLLDVAGYGALWVDGTGALRVSPRVLPAQRSVVYEALGVPRNLIDGAQSIYRPGAEQGDRRAGRWWRGRGGVDRDVDERGPRVAVLLHLPRPLAQLRTRQRGDAGRDDRGDSDVPAGTCPCHARRHVRGPGRSEDHAPADPGACRRRGAVRKQWSRRRRALHHHAARVGRDGSRAHEVNAAGGGVAVTGVTFTWATVTAVNPLAIKLDGDSAALGLIPDSLVDPLSLTVGDRVRVEQSLRRVVVHGRSGGDVPSPAHFVLKKTVSFGWTATLTDHTWDAALLEGALGAFTTTDNITYTCVVPGVYSLIGNLASNTGTASTDIFLLKNGTRVMSWNGAANGSYYTGHPFAVTLRFAVGDTFKIQLGGSGGTLGLPGDGCFLAVDYIGV